LYLVEFYRKKAAKLIAVNTLSTVSANEPVLQYALILQSSIYK